MTTTQLALVNISSSAMADRPCNACSAILRGRVTFRLNFRLKGYISCQYLLTIRWGNGYTTTLPLHIFTKRNFVADFIHLKLNFIQTNKKSLSEPPFGGPRANICTPSIALWKAHGWLPIRYNWTFSLSSMVHTL